MPKPTEGERLGWIVDRLEGESSTIPALRDAYLVAVGEKCIRCEAEPGDNEYCVFDAEPHPWVSPGR